MKGLMVVLVSGGPMMVAEAIEGENVVCSWEDDQGKRHRKVFLMPCLGVVIDMRDFLQQIQANS